MYYRTGFGLEIFANTILIDTKLKLAVYNTDCIPAITHVENRNQFSPLLALKIGTSEAKQTRIPYIDCISTRRSFPIAAVLSVNQSIHPQILTSHEACDINISFNCSRAN